MNSLATRARALRTRVRNTPQHEPAKQSDKPDATARRAMSLVLLALAAEIAIMYGRSITNGLVGDDWLLIYTSRTLSVAVSWAGGYHYNPISQAFMWLMYRLFGLHAVYYHIVAYVFFWLDAVLILAIARRMTRRFSIGALAAALFIAFGTPYEAVIWGLVSLLQTMGLATYLAGFLFYLRAQDPQLDATRRRQSHIGFVVAIVLSPFIYEQTLSLIVICALYRFLVIERTAGFSPQALLTRARNWLRDFAVPAAFLLSYLGLKWWMNRHSFVPVAPGLTYSWHFLMSTAVVGFFRAYLPGLGFQPASWLAYSWTEGHSRRIVAGELGELLVMVIGFVVVKPVYKFLIVWTFILVISMTLGLGTIESRHLLMITMPAAIMWAGFLVYLASKVRGWLERTHLPSRWVARLALAPSVLLAIAFGIAGFTYVNIQEDQWALAAANVQDAVTHIGIYARANPKATTLYIVDVRDSYLSATGDTVYLFRNVPQVFAQLAYPGRFKDVVAVRTYNYNWAQYYSILATPDQVAQWSRQPGALVLWYDDATGTLRQWTPPTSQAPSGAIAAGS